MKITAIKEMKIQHSVIMWWKGNSEMHETECDSVYIPTGADASAVWEIMNDWFAEHVNQFGGSLAVSKVTKLHAGGWMISSMDSSNGVDYNDYQILEA